MTKLVNSQKIKKIIMKPVAFTKCAIGQDWYKNILSITIEPGAYYPDYMEVNDWIMQNIDGKELNIEEVVDLIYNFIVTEYEPETIKVTNSIEGCKTHFDVIVEK